MKLNLLVITTCLLLVLACKKEKSITNEPTTEYCNVVSLLQNDTSYYQYITDITGKLITLKTKYPSTKDTDIVNYTYNLDNTISLSNGGKIFLNDKKLADSVLIIVNSSFGNFNGFINTVYNDKNQPILQKIVIYIFSSVLKITVVKTWENDNIIKEVETLENTGNPATYSTRTFTYYADKPNTSNQSIANLNYNGVMSKNLIKTEVSVGDNNYVKNYTYEFNNNKVTKQIVTADDQTVTNQTYSWLCK